MKFLNKALLGMITVMLGMASFAKAAEIVCVGTDGAGQNFALQLKLEKGIRTVSGVLKAQTVKGIKVISKNAGLADLYGKEPDWETLRFDRDLYVESDEVFMNLSKVARQKYEGELCGPHNNITIGGVQFTSNDCLNISCRSKGLSSLR
ncbi:hypothetical protein [uncultured Bdellovibrio sp.]|uniref:hypothetical protein n=1 Tax=Bdellovibrio sp. HCB-162 TaxID=3394234 RepID=UPI0025FAB322|nr:hypothetical protein [uncultured Bdellovibrio sp.]